jgi:thiol:disulfide interchange protein DsbA
MRIIRLILSAFVLLVTTGVAHAAAPVKDVDYVMLASPQSTIAGKKVEVIEFFAYYCPHCNALDTPLANWVKAQGDNIVFKRVHTSVTGEEVPQQRLYYTLEAMGKVDEFHSKILFAIHSQRKHLDTEDDIADFIATLGIDRQKFLDAYHSFAVQSKVTRALQMQNSYEIHTWPTIVVDGRFVTAPPIAGAAMDPYNENVAQVMMLKVLDGLVQQQLKERSK